MSCAAAARRAVRYYEDGVDRLEGRWNDAWITGDRYRSIEHLYAADLDLFGRGSLFELICAARTVPGERTLARWLCEAAPPPEVRERQVE